MNISVYDTYVKNQSGTRMHFDVFLNSENATDELALEYAQKFMRDVNQSADKITFEKCAFCHQELANPAIQKYIDTFGYFILQMEGCPEPFKRPL